MTSDDPKKNKTVAIGGTLAAIVFLLALSFGLSTSKDTAENQEPLYLDEGPQDDGHDHAHEDHADEEHSEKEFEKYVFKPAVGRTIGDTNATVKVVEYSSLSCGHCASFHKNTLPTIREKYVDAGDVYFQFEDFPLNAPALQASLIARCLPEGRYVGFVDLLFKTQEDWTTRPDYITPIKQNAKLAGLNDDGVEACLENKELRNEIAEEIKRATQKWDIRSTPTFIVTGPEGQEILRGAQPIYEFERAFRKVSGGKVAPTDDNSKEAPKE